MPKLIELYSKWAMSPPKNFFKGVWQQLRGQRYFNPRQAHWITLTIHIINCCLIYLAFGHNNISLLASLFFAINPITTQGGSIWISGKPYSTSTTMVLMMYLLPWISPLFYYLTSFCSANAMFSPFPFFFTKYWFLGFMPIVAFPIMFKVVMKKWKLQNTSNNEMVAIAPRKIIPFMKTYGYYFRICLMPYKLGLYHAFLWGVGVSPKYNKKAYKLNKDFWIGLVLLTASIWLTYVNRHNLLGFGLAWFMINISIFLNLVTIQQQVADRYCYLPAIGLMLSLAYLSSLYPFLIPIVLTYYATRLWHYRYSYMNDYWHIEYNVMEQPNAHYAWLSRGIKKFYFNDFDGALRDFCESRLFVDHDFKTNFNMAVMLFCLGNLSESELYLKIAEENHYEGVEEQQKKDFTTYTRQLIERRKKGENINLSEVRIIKILPILFLIGEIWLKIV